MNEKISLLQLATSNNPTDINLSLELLVSLGYYDLAPLVFHFIENGTVQIEINAKSLFPLIHKVCNDEKLSIDEKNQLICPLIDKVGKTDDLWIKNHSIDFKTWSELNLWIFESNDENIFKKVKLESLEQLEFIVGLMEKSIYPKYTNTNWLFESLKQLVQYSSAIYQDVKDNCESNIDDSNWIGWLVWLFTKSKAKGKDCITFRNFILDNMDRYKIPPVISMESLFYLCSMPMQDILNHFDEYGCFLLSKKRKDGVLTHCNIYFKRKSITLPTRTNYQKEDLYAEYEDVMEFFDTHFTESDFVYDDSFVRPMGVPTGQIKEYLYDFIVNHIWQYIEHIKANSRHDITINGDDYIKSFDITNQMKFLSHDSDIQVQMIV